MSARQLGSIGLLALLGIVVAAGIGLLTNAIAGDSIGLSASSLQPGRQLAPPQADAATPSPKAHRDHPAERHETTASTTTTTAAPAPTTTVPPVTTTGELEPFDDHGGTSGSSGSGSSGSSGSGSSGSGGLDD